jgi:hypothetical protein
MKKVWKLQFGKVETTCDYDQGYTKEHLELLLTPNSSVHIRILINALKIYAEQAKRNVHIMPHYSVTGENDDFSESFVSTFFNYKWC